MALGILVWHWVQCCGTGVIRRWGHWCGTGDTGEVLVDPGDTGAALDPHGGSGDLSLWPPPLRAVRSCGVPIPPHVCAHRVAALEQ